MALQTANCLNCKIAIPITKSHCTFCIRQGMDGQYKRKYEPVTLVTQICASCKISFKPDPRLGNTLCHSCLYPQKLGESTATQEFPITKKPHQPNPTTKVLSLHDNSRLVGIDELTKTIRKLNERVTQLEADNVATKTHFTTITDYINKLRDCMENATTEMLDIRKVLSEFINVNFKNAIDAIYERFVRK